MSQPDRPAVHDTALELAAQDGGDSAAAQKEKGADDNHRCKDTDGEQEAVGHVVRDLLQEPPFKAQHRADLAIVAVQLSDIPADTMSKIKVATMGDSDQIKVGQQVIAIGNALGYGQSVTVGYVSALDREIEDEKGISRTFIQTDAAINPGNSGGALLDLNGNVIGINAAKTASTEVEGMGFAIPISKAQDILNTLMTKKTRVAVSEDAQGTLGIRVTNIDAATSKEFGMPVGVYVYQIMEDGAAAKSDLKEKDIITKFDGQSVTSMEELTRMLTYYESGSTVTLTVQSLVNGAYVEHEVQVTLGARQSTNS
ncbi:MAG: trypsin-like peptidase domain-containing protein [Clostridium sp.]|nr:trypsin-like peptidase domain-containing protein [Clostridium sp.]